MVNMALEHWLYSPLLLIGLGRLGETVLLLTLVMRWGNGLASIGLASGTRWPGTRQGVIWAAVFGLVAALGFGVFRLVGLDPFAGFSRPLFDTARDFWIYFIVGGLISPGAEELFFRGIIYGYLRRWGIGTALAGSTMLFGAAHLVTGNLQITQVVGGIVFALAYEREKSLITPIIIHVLGNMAIFTLTTILP